MENLELTQDFRSLQPWAQFGGGHGDGGRVLPLFQVGGKYAMSPPLFLFRFCIWRSSKNKSDVCHVLRDVLFMLDVTHSQVDIETVWRGIIKFC